ncbi:DgyrCDS7985 [Dimorphilus gyrociliatus]|uniref:DgyrCDS7985 n=1 Tax=Dimorphilus gyrociliatus TaxID=2664684 RepID=A0A7I8VTV7_9ANNE|nr:DgyrCDS7985 [Dimorphilus gyrociliatus]
MAYIKAKIALLISVAIWIAALLFAIPWPIVYTVRSYEGAEVCSDAFDSIEKRASTFILLFIFGYVIPLAAIAVFSYLLVRSLWSVPKTQNGNTAKKKVTRLIISVVLAFATCWLPTHLFSLYVNLRNLLSSRPFRFTTTIFVLRQCSHVISYANSAINPVLYALLSRHFRLAFKRALRCRNRGSRTGGRGLMASQPLPFHVRLQNIRCQIGVGKRVNHSV